MRVALAHRPWRGRPVFGVIVIIAATALLFAAVPRGNVARPATPQPPAPIQTWMMVAARPVLAGTIVGSADVRAKPVTGTTPPGAITSRENAIGRITGKSYGSGEEFLQDDLRDAATAGIAARVLPGDRAFSIRVIEDEIVGGFLQSGDHVDVFATIPGSAFPTRDAQDLPDRTQTVLLLQNVPVLAVGDNSQTKGLVQSSARTVSLSLPPDQLARLALALRFGKVSLAIRKPGDTSVAAAATATLADLVPLQATHTAALTPSRKHGTTIPLFSGTHTSLARLGDAP